MSAAWIDELQTAWAQLALHPAQARQFRTLRLAPELSLDIYAALRAADDAPCLIVPTPVPPSALFEVGGMRLGAAPGDDRPLLVLSLEDPARSDLFATVCSDVMQTAATEGPADSLTRFLARLDAWRRFLRERRTGLSQKEVAGLIGELLVLQRLLSLHPGLLSSWAAPEDGLHDFDRKGHALEVKSTLGVAALLWVSTLDQLDVTGLRHLDLLHVRLVESPVGRSLGQLADEIGAHLEDETARRLFGNALLRRGLMPDDVAARAGPVVELRSLTAFRVSEAFPKLIRAAVPPAVAEAEYGLELRAIERHAVDIDDVLTAFAGGTAA